MPQPQFTNVPLGQLGNIEVSTYQTATGPRLRLRRHPPGRLKRTSMPSNSRA